jgi:hypothetical protein
MIVGPYQRRASVGFRQPEFRTGFIQQEALLLNSGAGFVPDAHRHLPNLIARAA